MSARFWDLIVEGEEHLLGSHRFEAEAIKAFASKYDPQPFHLDEAAAARSLLGGLCASGWHTAGVYMRLNVEHGRARLTDFVAAGNRPPLVGPSPGVRNIRWPKPVMAGDTITYRQTVTEKRVSESRPGWGVISFNARGENERGDPVFSLDGAAFYGTD